MWRIFQQREGKESGKETAIQSIIIMEMKITGHGNDRLSDIVEWKNCPSTRRLLGVENMVIDAIIVD